MCWLTDGEPTKRDGNMTDGLHQRVWWIINRQSCCPKHNSSLSSLQLQPQSRGSKFYNQKWHGFLFCLIATAFYDLPHTLHDYALESVDVDGGPCIDVGVRVDVGVDVGVAGRT